MSILDFLRVIEQSLPTLAGRGTAPPSRSRRLALERLDGRAVLAADSFELTLPPVEPVALPPAMEPISPPSLDPSQMEPTPTDPPPSDPSPTDPPPTDPPPTDPPPPTDDPPADEYHPPEVVDFHCRGNSAFVYFTGSVIDDEAVAGLTVYIMSTAGTYTVTVDADGTFTTQSFPWDPGMLVSAWTIDLDGNYSEVMSLVI